MDLAAAELERQWLTRSWAHHKTHLTSVRAADVADLTKIWARAGLDADVADLTKIWARAGLDA